ncbi:MAG: peptidoglycan-binding domain-containing protein, partial [Sedimentisphaerales bacterium]|nr:peptidoglycan-binding domain-containing protein [Sedimentisphaerales bacterium]
STTTTVVFSVASTPPASAVCRKFVKPLAYLNSGAEVKLVQQFLKNLGFFKYPITTNFFGPVTFAAVNKFQQVYKTDILTPLGLSYGTGFWGPSTMKKANALLGCK